MRVTCLIDYLVSGGAQRQLCTLDVGTAKTYCAAYGGEYGDIDYTLDSKGVDAATGKRYVVLVAKGATPGVFSVKNELVVDKS